MALDPSIPLSVRPPQIDQPTEALGKIMQLQGQRQQMQARSLQLQEAERRAAANKAVDDLGAQLVKPDGSINRDAVRSHLAEKNLMHLWPSIDEGFTQLEESHARLQETQNKVADEETDYAASLAAQVDRAGNTPEAALSVIGIAKKQGRLSPDQAEQILQGVLADPTPAGIGKITAGLIQKSDHYRALMANESRAASENKRASIAADRLDQQEKERKHALDVATASKSLYVAASQDPTGARYKAAYEKTPEELQSLFDPPEAFSKTTTPQRALEAGQTPDQIIVRRETAARDLAARARQDAQQAHQNAVDAETARHHRAMEGKGGGATDATYTRDFKEYQTFLTNQERVYRDQLGAWERFPTVDASGNLNPPKAPDSPDFDDWRAKKQAGGGKKTPGAGAKLKMQSPDGKTTAWVALEDVATAQAKGATIVGR